MIEEGYEVPDAAIKSGSLVLLNPPKATWEWCIGGDWFALTVRLPLKPPRGWWFHRLMQRLVLGIHWRECS